MPANADEALEALFASVNQLDARVRQQVVTDVAGFYRETALAAAKDSPERKAAEKAIANLRADKKPSENLRDLRNEVVGLQKENRELRQSVDDLKKKFTELTASLVPAKAAETKKKAKKKQQ